MKTPAGKECSYFYGNYFRGANKEECRLIGDAAPPYHWTAELCKKCPVPEIQLANNCEFMQLRTQIKPGFLGRFRQILITAYCSKKGGVVEDPMVGCGICHPLPVFKLRDQE